MTTRTRSAFGAFAALTIALSSIAGAAPAASAPSTAERPASRWAVGTPIVTYYAGPAMSEAVARQMAEGGFNVVWCGEKDLDLLRRHGLRGMLHDPLLAPATLDDAARRAKLDELIARVRVHPAMYSYYLTDEPAASAFPALGKLVAHLRERDPAHMAYVNLFPTYATNEQLGTKGDTVAAYREHLRQFVQVVKPDLISYDHYQFYKGRDTDQYFLNLALVRRAALDADVPFLNIIQASAWQPAVRVPTADETRYLVYTTLAYGAQGISYYVYTAADHAGGIAAADGTPTAIYPALKALNPQFVTIAKELQPLRSRGVYHTALKEPGCEPLPPDAAFRPEAADTRPPDGARGLAIGYFGAAAADGPTHALVVNVDYKVERRATLAGPAALEVFDAETGRWQPANALRVELTLPPGGGKLVRLAR